MKRSHDIEGLHGRIAHRHRKPVLCCSYYFVSVPIGNMIVKSVNIFKTKN